MDWYLIIQHQLWQLTIRDPANVTVPHKPLDVINLGVAPVQTQCLLVKRDSLCAAEKRQSADLASQHNDIMRDNKSLCVQLSTALDVGAQSHQVRPPPHKVISASASPLPSNHSA